MFKKLISIDAFLPRIQANISGIDTDMLVAFVSDAINQFCRETNLLRHLECIPLQKCVTAYKLPLFDLNFLQVTSCSVLCKDARISPLPFNYVVNDGYLHILSDDDFSDCVVELEYSLIPLRDSSEVPEVIYEMWLEAINHLVLFKLYLLTDMDWANASLARYHKNNYDTYIAPAKTQNYLQHKGISISLGAGRWRR